MPTKRTPARSRSTSKSRSKTSAGYVKFSDKLTDSLNDIEKMINEHKNMIDAIQEISLELTEAIGTLHKLTVKYATKANQILDVLLPIVKNLPVIPKNVKELLVDLEKWTQNIIDDSKKTNTIITDVQSGLKTGNVDRVKKHTSDLQKVTKTLTNILPSK